jgi:hypothetical protein
MCFSHLENFQKWVILEVPLVKIISFEATFCLCKQQEGPRLEPLTTASKRGYFSLLKTNFFVCASLYVNH